MDFIYDFLSRKLRVYIIFKKSEVTKIFFFSQVWKYKYKIQYKSSPHQNFIKESYIKKNKSTKKSSTAVDLGHM